MKSTTIPRMRHSQKKKNHIVPSQFHGIGCWNTCNRQSAQLSSYAQLRSEALWCALRWLRVIVSAQASTTSFLSISIFHMIVWDAWPTNVVCKYMAWYTSDLCCFRANIDHRMMISNRQLNYNRMAERLCVVDKNLSEMLGLLSIHQLGEYWKDPLRTDAKIRSGGILLHKVDVFVRNSYSKHEYVSHLE